MTSPRVGNSGDPLSTLAISSPSSQSTAPSSMESFHVSAPSLSLPKGGGALRGIDEKFAANPVTGAGALTVFIPASKGRSGFDPQLSLSYDSSGENGPFGFGWSVSLPLITRRTDKGLPRYMDDEESDIFMLSGVEDLVPVLVCDGDGRWIDEPIPPRDGYAIQSYRPRTEGLFARIERWTRLDDGATHWRSNGMAISHGGQSEAEQTRHGSHWFTSAGSGRQKYGTEARWSGVSVTDRRVLDVCER